VRKVDEDEWSEHSSDEDESAQLPRREKYEDDGVSSQYQTVQEEPSLFEQEDDGQPVEYVDEMGRTRMGTRAEAREAERAKRPEERRKPEEAIQEQDQSSYAEVM
jgi:large subunit ribosomal protein L24e